MMKKKRKKNNKKIKLGNEEFNSENKFINLYEKAFKDLILKSIEKEKMVKHSNKGKKGVKESSKFFVNRSVNNCAQKN